MKIGKDRFIFNLMKRNFENLKFVDFYYDVGDR